MSESVARALGANETRTVTIAGKKCTVRPLGLRELTEVERLCVKQYKRNLLETYAENVDLLSESERAGLMREKLDEVALWDIDDLPPKRAHDATKIKATKKLREYVIKTFAADDSIKPLQLKQLVTGLLDSNAMNAATYKKYTDEKPPSVLVPYASWWITGSHDGMITLIWTCFKDDGVTKDEVARELGSNKEMLIAISRDIEHVTVPAVKNG